LRDDLAVAPVAALEALELLKELDGALPLKAGGLAWGEHCDRAAEPFQVVGLERIVIHGAGV
jgi:hypothetical protein